MPSSHRACTVREGAAAWESHASARTHRNVLFSDFWVVKNLIERKSAPSEPRDMTASGFNPTGSRCRYSVDDVREPGLRHRAVQVCFMNHKRPGRGLNTQLVLVDS